MTNKNIFLLVVLVIVVVLGGVYLVNQQMQQAYNPKTQGKVVFGITDAAADMSGISSVFITVDKVQVHSATNGWVTVSTTTKEYDLLALKQSGAVFLLANENLDIGTYDQVLLTVSKVIVVKNGVKQEAKLPSGELKMLVNIVVNADTTSSVVFDFIADKSLHMTGNGKFIFAPVIKIEKRGNVIVEIGSDDQITITGGNQEIDENVGMDEKGEIKNNFELKGNLNIDQDDAIKLEGNIEGTIDGKVKIDKVLD